MKNLIKLLIVLVIVLGGLRFFFPPLKELGYATSDDGISARVMVQPKGGADPLQIFIEAAEGFDQPAFASEICDSLIVDMVGGDLPLAGINDAGNIEIQFITGGRYFYRFSKPEPYSFKYASEGCEQSETATDG